MAVVQISRIQVRRGQEQQTGIPPLAGGEFAWATDTEKLYIGLKREDGGARDTNLQVLTENDLRQFKSFIESAVLDIEYTWALDSHDTITSASNESARIRRSTQNKLDDIVNVADFGVIASTGTAVNDCSIELQIAIDNLFLGKNVEWNNIEYELPGSPTLQYNKRLYFPPGVYKIGETVLIPKNTVLVGEGIDKTIIEVITTGTSAFQTVDYANRRSNPNYGQFDAASTNSTVLSITGGANQPKNIHIEGMTIRYSTATGVSSHLSLLSLDCVDNVTVKSVKFKGNDTWSSPLSNTNYNGIDIRGYRDITSENVLIDNCQFEGLHYTVRSNYDTNQIVIQNSSFNNSVYGIAFSTSTNVVATSGPTYARIVNNKFQNIYNQGIFVGANRTGVPTNHVSQNNSFVRVGDQGITEGNSSAGTSVIKFATPGNASVNDYFGRVQFHNLKLGTPADSTSTYYPLIDGKATIDLNSVTTATGAAFADTPIMRLPITGNSQYLQLKYAAISAEVGDNIQRFGTLQVYIRPGFDFSPSSPNQVKLIDEYNSSGSDGGLYWGIAADSTYKYVELFLINPQLTAIIQLELQTKLML
jgi:hypothetical protein